MTRVSRCFITSQGVFTSERRPTLKAEQPGLSFGELAKARAVQACALRRWLAGVVFGVCLTRFLPPAGHRR